MDNHTRNSVLKLWHSVYTASDGYSARIQWTGDFSGRSGSVSPQFIKDVERRVNFYRALAGLPSDVSFNTGSQVVISDADKYKPGATTKKVNASQDSALMLVRNFDPGSGSAPAMTHDPTPNLIGWSPASWNANAKGNLAFGLYGPGAVDAYMKEELGSGSATSPWNYQVGHRRWLLNPDSTDFATGDQPGDGEGRPSSNIIYVIQSKTEKRALVSDFVAYPPAGFFPAPLNSRYWSLGHAKADFTSARVRVTDSSGLPVPVKGTHQDSSFGGPAFVWEVTGPAASQSTHGDVKFHVTVDGIKGEGIPASYSYEVTLTNPLKLTDSLKLSGPADLKAMSAARYTLQPVAEATAARIEVARMRPASWRENAENPRTTLVSRTQSKAYPLVANIADYGLTGALGGASAFHLTFPTVYDPEIGKTPDQIFTITRPVIPSAGAKLEFSLLAGYMTATTRLIVETSRDGGATWQPVGQPVSGRADNLYSAVVRRYSLRLPRSSQPVVIRFRLTCDAAKSIYVHQEKVATGVFIDDISVRKCIWLQQTKTNNLPSQASSFVFNAASAGGRLVGKSQWVLRLSTRVGGHWFPAGPAKTVRVR